MPGWRTKRKIVVIESDDWGSIRMPNRDAYNNLYKQSDFIKNNPYCRFDTLASSTDLEALFEVLLKHKDKNNRPGVITANTVVANPNFQRIAKSNYEKYNYEPFTETLKSYYPNEDTWGIWKQGISHNVFHPQFHGREHVNVLLWFKLLKDKDPIAMKSFIQLCWIIPPMQTKPTRDIQASYDIDSDQGRVFITQAVKEGLELFERLFGYKSESFIANNFIWDKEVENVLNKGGVRFIQGMKYQKLPVVYNHEKRKMVRHYLGATNEHKQTYLVRNCVFEPSQYPASFNSLKSCLADIENAFFWNKPAIITTHRLNFIGGLEENNRRNNLRTFNTLLKEMLKRWPDIEFMTSDELGRYIEISKSKELQS
ncbi:polysaccharide (de)acetylase [Mangrovimonas aestuarii]|uniref:polysaccharide (de)acetylase n=1 Tax=Mangrovimonas aestuarii TaxID=3018443 RepID=UPI002377E3D5|nr:polysaccharide (de)acetylase [Mangrovimonas aestuarii]